MLNEKAVQHRMSAGERQCQLLEVALHAFSRRGFKGTTTKEIAAAAGVAEAVIFQHFPSKDALYSAVLELHLETSDEHKWIEEVTALMDRNEDEAVFRSFILRILSSYRRDPMIQRVILFAALEGHQQGLARMQKQFAPILERFMEFITRRQREGALTECNPGAIMIGLGGVAHQYGLITQIFLGAPTPGVSDEDIAGIFTQMLLRGVHRAGSSDSACGDDPEPVPQSNRKAKK